jgi:hypothetical protein
LRLDAAKKLIQYRTNFRLIQLSGQKLLIKILKYKSFFSLISPENIPRNNSSDTKSVKDSEYCCSLSNKKSVSQIHLLTEIEVLGNLPYR